MRIKNWWADCWSRKVGCEKIVKDSDVAEYAYKHLRLRDKFNINAISSAVLMSHCILMGDVEEPEGKWFFGDKKEF